MSRKLEDLTKEELLSYVRQLQKDTKFGLVWNPKEEQIVQDCNMKIPVLNEVDDKKISNASLDDNTHLLIEGDNYHSLSVLNYTHSGKVDVIYIDPPYNTGNKDFIYNDHYVDKEDPYKHSEWLSFMDNRLRLAKNLLSNSGVIFISIDDNEQAHLKLLCDTIFGADNFVACVPRKTGAGSAATRSSAELRKLNDYILIYRKTDEVEFRKKVMGQKQYPLEDESGKYMLGQFQASGSDATRSARPNMWYPIYLTNEGKLVVNKPENYKKEFLPNEVNGQDGRWLWNRDKFTKDSERLIYFDGIKLSRKIYFNEKDDHTIYQVEKAWIDESIYQNSRGTTELNGIFGKKGIFSNPKPSALVEFLINLHPNSSALVLDFFAGSGTTGHAVLKLNQKDGGNRRFILGTNNENGIAENITYQRLAKVIKGYADAEGIPANLRYFKTNFVDTNGLNTLTDQDKLEIAKEMGTLIALRENSFERTDQTDYWQTFENSRQITAIYYREDKLKIDEYITNLNAQDKPVKLYIFGWGKNAGSEYASNKIRVEDIPEPLIEVFKEIAK